MEFYSYKMLLVSDFGSLCDGQAQNLCVLGKKSLCGSVIKHNVSSVSFGNYARRPQVDSLSSLLQNTQVSPQYVQIECHV